MKLYENPTFWEHLQQILFLDIETVPCVAHFDDLTPTFQALWLKKAASLRNPQELPLEELFAERAGVFAEFGRVICIGLGSFYGDPENPQWHQKLLIENPGEPELLLQLQEQFNQHRAGKNLKICAHNGKEFDFPFLARRMLIQGITPLPTVLQMQGKKPWEIPWLDTLDEWKFGDYKHYTSLDLLTALFDIPSPKSDITGADVANVYYQQKDLERIGRYCLGDVHALAHLYVKMKGFTLAE